MTVQLSVVLVINQLNAHTCFIISLLYASACFENCCVHHQEVKILLYGICYRPTETSEWSKINFRPLT